MQDQIRHGCWVLAPRMLAVAAVLAAAPGMTAGQVQAQQLQPHRAVYEIELESVRGTPGISDVGGAMEFTWTDVCGGWTMEQDSRLAISFGEQSGTELGWRYNAWESDAGDRLRFFLRRFQDGAETQALRGEARLGDDGGTAEWRSEGDKGDGEAETHSLDLPPDTLFPKSHTSELIHSMRADEGGFFSHLFDGTGETGGLHALNALVLTETTGEPASLDSALLQDVRSWRVTMAFFDPEERGGAPESEQTARLFANGITDTLRIDYGDFVVKAVLSELEELERPEC